MASTNQDAEMRELVEQLAKEGLADERVSRPAVHAQGLNRAHVCAYMWESDLMTISRSFISLYSYDLLLSPFFIISSLASMKL